MLIGQMIPKPQSQRQSWLNSLGYLKIIVISYECGKGIWNKGTQIIDVWKLDNVFYICMKLLKIFKNLKTQLIHITENSFRKSGHIKIVKCM